MDFAQRRSLLSTVKGLYVLTRFLPTISWGISASLMGLAFALPDGRFAGADWLNYVLVLINVVLLHGVASHAINDLYDWQSGTDRLSPGNYSGGSKVIRKKLLSQEQLKIIAIATIIMGTLITFILLRRFGYSIFIFWGIALWSSIAYTQPPFRLSYRPLLGEWLAGFPAVGAVTVLTYFIFTETVSGKVLLAAALQALFAVGLLMFHHISDVSSDLAANPPKITTVAYAAGKWGQARCNLVAVLYFALIIPLSLIGLFWHPVFILSAIFALPCIFLSYRVKTCSVRDITARESWIFALVITHAVAYFVAKNTLFTIF